MMFVKNQVLLILSVSMCLKSIRRTSCNDWHCDLWSQMIRSHLFLMLSFCIWNVGIRICPTSSDGCEKWDHTQKWLSITTKLPSKVTPFHPYARHCRMQSSNCSHRSLQNLQDLATALYYRSACSQMLLPPTGCVTSLNIVLNSLSLPQFHIYSRKFTVESVWGAGKSEENDTDSLGQRLTW